MLIDHIRNAPLYYGLGERIKQALLFLQGADLAHKEPGRYELDGDNLYALIQYYDTKPRSAAAWEAHRRYTDVQYVAEGRELMGYAPLATLQVVREYKAAEDCLWLSGVGDFITVRAGMFVIFSPDDAHQPGLAINDQPQRVKKVVVKTAVLSPES